MYSGKKAWGGTSYDAATSIQELSGGGGYIVAGSSASADGDLTVHHGVVGVDDIWVVRLTATGGIVWQKTLGGSSTDGVSSIKVTPDGGYILAGSSNSNDGDINGNIGLSDFWIIKLTGAGAIQWQRRLGGTSQDAARDVQLTADGGYIIAGFSYSADGNITGNHGISDYWVVKLSSSGVLQWQKSLGGTQNDVASSVQTVLDGYIVAGYAQSSNGDITGSHGGWDYWIVKLSSAGDKIWQKSLGGTSDDLAYSIASAPGGGFITVGYSFSNNGDVSGNHGGTDGWAVKLTNDSIVTIKANTGTNICVNTKVTFTASVLAGIQSPAYQWKKNNINVGTNSATYVDSLLATGDSVFCIVTSTGRVDASNAIRFTTYNNYQPTIKISGSNSLCDGEKTTYTAVVTNAAPEYHLQWKVNGINAGSDSLTYTTASLQNGDSVWCVVTSITGCAVSPVVASSKIKVKITANVLPTISIARTPAVYNFCTIASKVKLSFHSTIKNGGAAPHYQWKKNNVNVGTDTTYYTDSLSNGDSVWCVFTSSQKCLVTNNVLSNKIAITITAPVKPAVTIAASSAGATCLHTPVRFKATVKNGGNAPHYQWKKNNTDVGTDSDTYNDSLLVNNDSVWCVFTSNLACVINNPVTSAKIKASITNSSPLKPSPISGPTTVAANQQGNGYSVTKVNDVTYTWTVPAGCTIVSGQGTNQVVINWGPATGSMVVRARNACGPSDSAKLTVRVTPSFSSSVLAGNTGTCEALHAEGKDGVQLYPNPAGNFANIFFSTSNAGKYFVQLTDAQGRVLQNKEINANKGVNKIALNVAAYAQGVYFIRLAGAGKQQQSFRLLIQR